MADRPISLLALAVWAGLVTGFAEVAVIARELLGPEFAQRSRDAVWMIPAFDAALFGLLGIVVVGLARLVRVPYRAAAGVFAGMGTLLVLLLFPRLHWLASVIVAVGVALQVARFLAPRQPAASRLVRRSLPWLAVSVALLAVLTVSWRTVRERLLGHARPPAERGAPNVLLLILDTVRAADMSLYGYARRTTPELERFAERATVFDRAFAPSSWTLQSHASMFTGRDAFELRVSWDRGLGPEWPTLAEVLRARGYATAAFVANEVFTGWESGLGRGFERLDDYSVSLWTAASATSAGNAFYPRLRRHLVRVVRHLPLLGQVRLPMPKQHRSADQINAAFLAWLDQSRPAPFFAFLNFMDAHTPYVPPDSFRHRFASPKLRPPGPESRAISPKLPLTPAEVRPRLDTYDGSIAYLDSQLGYLLRELQRRRLLDNTLVVVTSDHGDEFAEHGLVDHGNSLYRFTLQVPLLVWFPGHVPESRVSAPVSLRNLAATVMDLLGTSRPPVLPGRSLARFWTEGGATPDTIVASVRRTRRRPAWYPASRGDLNSIAFDGWRYIRNEGDGAEELYDFDADLLERWNVVGTPEGDRLLPRYRAALGALLTGEGRPGLAEK